MKMKKNIYKGYDIYFFEEKFLNLGKNIVDKNLNLVNEIKNTDRNYVARIKYLGNEYILKSPKNEYKKIQRRLLTIFKKGEVLNTFMNINYMVEQKKIDFFALPYVAIVKRECRIIKESYLVLEYVKEEEIFSLKKIPLVLKTAKLLLENSIYHGDFNLSNIIFQKSGKIKLIDTQGKKCYFKQYRNNYDILTFEESIYRDDGISGRFGKMKIYNKNIWYYLAYFIKKMKRFL